MLAILAAVMLAAAPQQDTVFTADGGRVVGTVVEEGAQGIAIQLPDGTFRRLARREVLRIQYGDGTVSTIRPAEPPPPPAPPSSQPPPQYAPPPPPQYAPPPPPRYGPPPYPPPPRHGPPAYPPPPVARVAPSYGPISPFYLSFGLGAAFPGGKAERGFDQSDVFEPQADFAFEGGLRLTPHLALALYAGIGAGDAGRETRDWCAANGFACDAETRRIGLLLRHTFDPAARTTPWLAIGTGYETGAIVDDFYGDLVKYSGWEMLRLMAGLDFRTSQVFGVGLYGGVSLGRYSRVEDTAVEEDLDRATHTRIEAGLRFTLFP